MTTEQRRPPEQFIDWLFATYPEDQAKAWYGQSYLSWQDDPIYLHWEQNVRPPEPEEFTLTEFPWGNKGSIATILSSLESMDELKQTLEQWVIDQGISESDAFSLYEEHALRIDPYTYLGVPEETKGILSDFSNPQDLADRINRLGLETSDAEALYKGILSGESTESMAIRSSRGSLLEEQRQTQFTRDTERVNQQNQIQQLFTELSRKPEVTQADFEKAGISQDTLFTAPPEDVARRLVELDRDVRQRSRGEAQTAEALLAGLRRRPAPVQVEGLPPIPAAGEIAETFLEGTRLGEGTKLRRFIASELPSIVEETKAARLAWWRRMNPEPEDEDTFRGEQARLRGEVSRFAGIAAAAPTSTTAGNVYYGPGGLAAIARRASEAAQSNLAGLRPGDFARRRSRPNVPFEEDPLQKALRRKKFTAAFYRQPGTGLVSSLTPAVRF